MGENQLNLEGYFKTVLKPELFEDYAPNGLQVEGKVEIKRVAFAVSATLDSIKAAISWSADALVVHHGLFWKHQGPKIIIGSFGERIKQCIKNDLNLFAYHLPLDAHLEVGNAVALGEEIKLKNVLPFGPYKKQFLGVKGELSNPMEAEKLKLHLEKILSHPVVLGTPDPKAIITTIGIITGGANNEWSKAFDEGLDAYLTGEISEYNWHDAIESGVHYFAGGHHATEKFGIQSLMRKVKKDHPNLEVAFFDSPNPA